MRNYLNDIFLLRRLWLHIAKHRKYQLCGVGILMVSSTVFELVSIGAVVPFLGVLTAPEQVFHNQVIRSVAKTFMLNEPRQLILPITGLFVFSAILSGMMRILLLS